VVEIFSARGEDMRIANRGVDHLLTPRGQLTSESACSSVHVARPGSAPTRREFTCNAASQRRGCRSPLPQHAPFLFGGQLWTNPDHPVEQATDTTTRPDELNQQGSPPVCSANAGSRPCSTCRETSGTSRPPGPGSLGRDEDLRWPFLDGGERPPNWRIILHNGPSTTAGTVLYRPSSTGSPHLRVRTASFRAGPTVADIMAHAAFYYGLIRSLLMSSRPVWTPDDLRGRPLP